MSERPAALTPETMPLLMIHGAAMHAMAEGKPEDAAHITAILAQRLRKVDEALREIGLPTHVPEHFDPLDFWKHTACKRGEIARDALGITAEELILSANA